MDNTFKEKSSWTKIDEKPFHTAFLREITDQYESGDISYGKMVEMLNEVAIKWHNQVDISKMETTVSKTERVQTAVEYLLEKLYTEYRFEFSGTIVDQAKQMEKEQILDALEIYKKEHLVANSISIKGNAAELPTTTGNFIVKDKINLK